MKFDKFTLNNGLKVIVHNDATTPLVAINLLYNVGARDEQPDKTGFAHLFEHLMFGGSANIPEYDSELQLAGGENNAYTTNDVTNYYITIPKQNMETGFWLESDRMLDLAFSEKSLEVQRGVVSEEFKQRYLNRPYGDVGHLMRPLAFKQHSYQWPTIGKDLSHIENATMDDVKAFFHKYYSPNNAILSVAGDVTRAEIERLANKWFGTIPNRNTVKNILPEEPKQTEQRRLEVVRKVPYNSLFMGFHMGKRMDADYYGVDLLSDVLSNGNSSRLYRRLVQEKKIFSTIDAYIWGSTDNGLFEFTGRPVDGISLKRAEAEIWNEIELIKNELVTDYELQKVKNKVESTLVFGDINVLSKAENLARYELLGSADLINTDIDNYNAVTKDAIITAAQKIFVPENASVLHYLAEK
ncbi:MAG TPA: peptidase M16 [Bacteroidales bacterium]|nr:peptidase M16 [Bacteroidales bacterium]